MKKLILSTFSLLVTSLVLSQTITAKITKAGDFEYPGNVNTFGEISEKNPTKTVINDYKYVLDLDKKFSKFYVHGNYVSKVPIESVTKKGDTYYITLLDYGVYNPDQQIKTNIIVDQKQGTFIFFWYNDFEDVTKVELGIKPEITVKLLVN